MCAVVTGLDVLNEQPKQNMLVGGRQGSLATKHNAVILLAALQFGGYPQWKSIFFPSFCCDVIKIDAFHYVGS